MSVLRRLGHPNMVGLAAALAGRRIAPPFRRSQLLGHVSDELLDDVGCLRRSLLIGQLNFRDREGNDGSRRPGTLEQ